MKLALKKSVAVVALLALVLSACGAVSLLMLLTSVATTAENVVNQLAEGGIVSPQVATYVEAVLTGVQTITADVQAGVTGAKLAADIIAAFSKIPLPQNVPPAIQLLVTLVEASVQAILNSVSTPSAANDIKANKRVNLTPKDMAAYKALAAHVSEVKKKLASVSVKK